MAALGKNICAALALLASAALGAVKPNQPVSVNNTPSALLQESYELGRAFAPEQRAWLLERLTEASLHIDRRWTETWSEETFRSGRNLPITWNRLAIEKNALVSLSRVNPRRAMAFFSQMDNPIPLANGSLPEDVRADAARTVFAELYRERGASALSQIEREANRLGETGEYPYAAMASLISEARDSEVGWTKESFLRAVAYYQRGSKFLDEDRRFLTFVQELRKAVTPALERYALEALVARLMEQKPPRELNQSYRARVSTRNGAVELDNEAYEPLFEALPLIRDLDPAWAHGIAEKRPVLRSLEAAAGQVQHSESSKTFGATEGQGLSKQQET